MTISQDLTDHYPSWRFPLSYSLPNVYSPHAITNVVLRRDVVSRTEADGTDEAVAGPSKTHLKQHPPRTMPKMGITTVMIHHVAMDLE